MNGICNFLFSFEQAERQRWLDKGWIKAIIIKFHSSKPPSHLIPPSKTCQNLISSHANFRYSYVILLLSYRHNQSIQSVRTQTTVKRTPAPSVTSRTARQSIIVSLPTVRRSHVANDKKPPVPITSYSSQSLTQFIQLRWWVNFFDQNHFAFPCFSVV